MIQLLGENDYPNQAFRTAGFRIIGSEYLGNNLRTVCCMKNIFGTLNVSV
jgi:hypothetical protein